MVETKVKILNTTGMHARPAAMLAKEAKKYKAKITLFIRDKKIDASSILGILSMGAKCGDEILICLEGDDAQMAATAMEALFASNFGE